jgi:hypothetical protein
VVWRPFQPSRFAFAGRVEHELSHVAAPGNLLIHIYRTTGLPSDLSKPNRRVAKLNHGGEVRITAVRHTEHVCGKAERTGNVTW